jgi:hypothetical protein
MGDYNRSTRECVFEQLRPEMVSAIRAHAEKYALSDLESNILMCCETTSEKKKKGFVASIFFSSLLGGDPDPVHYTGIFVTPKWLVWIHSGAKRGVHVSTAKLKDVSVSDFNSKLVDDTGLEVFGFIGGRAERVTAFIGLGAGSVAQRFSETVKRAIEQAGG